MEQAALFEIRKNQTTRCLACCHYCMLNPGSIGVCGTRINRDGILYSLVYGNIVGPAIDPVEKKPLNHFLPGSTLLSFGTLGCNFGCLFCQNDWMSQATKISNKQISNKQIEIERTISRLSRKATPEELIDRAISSGSAGIAYTYNEPAIFVEFAYDVMKRAKKNGLKNVFVSNGYESGETFAYIKDYLDAINIDLKSFRPEFYRNLCKASIEPVKENIKRYFNIGIETEVTTLVIHGYNDSCEELTDIAKFLALISLDIPWHVSAFSPAYKIVNVPPTPAKSVIKAWEIGKKAGLRYVYTGNIDSDKHVDTVCPTCSALLVERRGYNTILKHINLSTGACKSCHTKIYGVWKI